MKLSLTAGALKAEILPGTSLVNYQPPAKITLEWTQNGRRHWSAQESWTAIDEIAPLLPPRLREFTYETGGVIARLNDRDADQINLPVRAGAQFEHTPDTVKLTPSYSMYRVIYPADELSAVSADDSLYKLSDYARSHYTREDDWSSLFDDGVYAQYRVLDANPGHDANPTDGISFAIERSRDFMHDERAEKWVGAFLLIFAKNDEGEDLKLAEVSVAPYNVRRGPVIQTE